MQHVAFSFVCCCVVLFALISRILIESTPRNIVFSTRLCLQLEECDPASALASAFGVCYSDLFSVVGAKF